MRGEACASLGRRGRLVLLVAAAGLSACLAAASAPAQGTSDPSGQGAAPPRAKEVQGDAPLSTVKVPYGERVALPVANPPPRRADYASVYMTGLPQGSTVSDSVHDVVVGDDVQAIDISSFNLEGLFVLLPRDLASRSHEVFVASVLAFPPWSGEGNPVQTETLSTMVIIPEVSSLPPLALDVPQPAVAVMSVPPAAAPPPGPGRDVPSRDVASRNVLSRDLPSRDLPSTDQPAPDRAGPRATGAAIAEPPSPAQPPPAADPGAGDEPSAVALLARAGQLLQVGNVSGARLLLLRAGSADATELLAQTYEEAFLRRLGVRGLRGDPERARSYSEAAARLRQGGVQRQARSAP
ncbi:hypothetical protein [Methylobacterium sp. WSM2598]|uniref:hypothetical protein n=1 Tax=Methylobacterium sp. WSM2598 TaxID=398261 RepID=UPI0003A70DA7|nr:hypothetical protein [Methylobacterium sp. WSM2598]